MKNKTPKILTEQDLISIVEATEEELSQADKRLSETTGKVLDGIFDPGTFSRLVKAGVYTCSTVKVKDKAAYVMIHTRNALGWLVVEGAVSLGGLPIRYLFEGADALATHLKAQKIVFVTRLKGLYDYASKAGWKKLGVILCK